MTRAWVGAFVVATAAWAVPPTPLQVGPLDGGWSRRQADLEARIVPSIPLNVFTFEFQVDAPLGTPVYQSPAPVDRSTSTTNVVHPTAALPDAGLLFWRVRAIEDGGVPSPWSAYEPFRVDDVGAPLPAPLTVTIDGGDATAGWPVVTDTQSGVREYHLLLGQLDAPADAGFTGYFDSRYLPVAPTQRVRLGPGTWTFGVHAHDFAGNLGGGSTLSAPVTVPSSILVPAPEAPRVVRFDGGAVPTFPYLRFGTVRFAWGPDAGAETVGYALIARVTGSMVWNHVGESSGNAVLVEFGDGRYDARVAQLEPGLVSDYSPQLSFVVDTTNPFTPNPSATLDAGTVVLRWNSVRDRSNGSGVLEYRVVRCCPPAELPNVPDVPDASVTTLDAPGPGDWRWDVAAVDRAGNVGSAGSAYVGPPPPQPGAPAIGAGVTRLPVALSWATVDAGAPVTWNLFRVDPAGGSVAIATNLSVLAAADPAPQGRWRYRLQAIARNQTSPLSVTSAEVLVDLELPDAGAVVAQRLAARTLRVAWDATDALSGVAAGAQLFRETGGVETPLGPATSPATVMPPDGTHRFRVEVADLAGNVSGSAWSAPIATPGTTLTIDPVEAQTAACGRETVVALTASGEPATQWSLVGAPAEEVAIDGSGRLTLTPTKTTPSPLIVTVRAESATSLDERAVTFDVTCKPVALSVGCGCGSAPWPAALAGLLLLALRRRRAC